ncbi:hypothetical protein BBJ28_00017734 [Nothophytophthora sp. Chile5]|nr:hypothetical protein BBJ28_00017734 [Nothophytophthora sp. Chile5]
MVHILRTQVAEAKEEDYDLRSNIAAMAAEIQFESGKKERAMQAKATALESNVAFLSAKLQNAERVKLRAVHEAEEMQQKLMLERKRLDAEKRLLATKRRKQEGFLAASQSLMSQRQQQQQQPTRPPVKVVTETAVQTELQREGRSGEEDGNGFKEVTSRLIVVVIAALQFITFTCRRFMCQCYCPSQENAHLVSVLLTTFSRDLLVMLNGSATGSGGGGNPSPAPNHSESAGASDSSTMTQLPQALSGTSNAHSMQQSPGGVPFSQSVFSQLAGRASAQAHASLLSFAIESNATQAMLATDRARELYDVIGRMLAGDVSAVALAPVFIKYLAAPTDLDHTVLSSVLRVTYSVMQHSEQFQQFLLVAMSPSDAPTCPSSVAGLPKSTVGTNSMEHPRISLTGLRYTSLDDYLSARKDQKSFAQDDTSQSAIVDTASEQRQLRAKLLSALCRVIKNNLNEPVVVEDGLCVLWFWVDLGLAHRPAFRLDFRPLLAANVIPAVVLAPKGPPGTKAHALGLLSQMLRFPEVFTEVEAETKKSLLFNRCAKMLDREGALSAHPASDVRKLQRQVVKLMLSITMSFPSVGIRFVLESTRGLPNDSDGHRSVVYYLAQLLGQETLGARITNAGGASYAEQQLLRDHQRVGLIQDAFTLMALLARYVDLPNELDGDDRVQGFLAVLHFLSTSKLEEGGNDAIATTARALIAMVNL